MNLEDCKSEAAETKAEDREKELEETAASGSEEEAAAKPPWWKLLYLWFCGLPTSPTPSLSQEEKAALEQRLTSIEEKPLWRHVCDVTAILLLAINVFLWAYYA